MTTPTILVTGATGNVGRPLVEQLLAAGHRVRALTRAPERARLPAGAEVIAGDLSDPASLRAAFTGVRAAHLIGVQADAGIVDVARQCGVRRFTVLRGDVTKSALDEAVEASGREWTFVAPVEFMSNTREWAESVRREGVVREAFPDVKSAMIHDADIAAVAAVALTEDGHAGQEYWLTGPEALTPRERVRILAGVLGRDLRLLELTRDEVVAAWRRDGYSDDDIAFFLAMRTDPPAAGYTVLPTVEAITRRPARTFAQWAAENAALFAA